MKNKSIKNDCMISRHCKHFHSLIFSNSGVGADNSGVGAGGGESFYGHAYI